MEIAETFNTQFQKWMEKTGCRATFGWLYGAGDKSPKALEIQAVDLIVFRKEPPTFATIQQAMEKADVSRKLEEKLPS